MKYAKRSCEHHLRFLYTGELACSIDQEVLSPAVRAVVP